MRGHSCLRGSPTSGHSGGFTLIELIFSIALLGILGAVGSSMIVDSFNTTRMVDADNASTGQARYAVERLAREIREVKFVITGGVGNYCINAPATNPTSNLVFYKTSGTFNNTTCATNAISTTINLIQIQATPIVLYDLKLGYSSPAVTTTLSSNVSSFTLAYYDVAGNLLTLPVDTSVIRFVVISLTVTDPTSGQSIAQRTRVALRNA
jgi:prepilin-type N-terminal cleavage/methylation domain-containing protein